MARVSFEFKKGDLVWIGLVVGLLCVGFGVAAWVDKPMFHDSEDVRVTIDGSDYSLQNASDLGLLGGGDFVPATMAGGSNSMGEVEFPNGLKMKWGQKAVGADSTVTVDFTNEGLTDFNEVFQVMVSSSSGSAANYWVLGAHTITRTSFKIYSRQISDTVHWFAIGR